MRTILAFTIIITALTLMPTALSSLPAGAAAAQGSPELKELTGINQLQDLFNRDKGKPRLVLLLSPTCSVCYRGTRWVDEEILKKYPDANLKVYAVWFQIMPTDSRARKPKELLADPRVTQFWDDGQVVGRWFGEHVTHPDIGVEWDAWFLYKPEAVWKESPTHLVDWGRTIIGTHEKLEEKFRSVVSP